MKKSKNYSGVCVCQYQLAVKGVEHFSVKNVYVFVSFM